MRRLFRTRPARGALLGAGLAAALFTLDLVQNAGFSVMGVRNDAMTQLVLGRFLGTVIGMQALILAVMVGLGAIAGGLVRTALGDVRRANLLTAAALVMLHLSWSAGALIHAPQLFTEMLYDHGGWRAALQVWLTDNLSPMQARLPAFALGGLVVARIAWMTWRRSPAVVVVSGALAAAIVLAGMRSPAPEPPQKGARNVLIVAVDSLRADMVPDAETAPNIAALAGRGTRVTRAYTAIPRTFPSWVTLLTGRWPSSHGIRHMFPRAEQRARSFDALPDRLGDRGYLSALVSDFAGDIFTRIDLGFDRVDAPTFHFGSLIEQRSLEVHPHFLPYVTGTWGRRLFPIVDEFAQLADASIVTDRAIDALDDMADTGKPWMLTVFYGNAHFPYAAQWPHYNRFADRDYTGPYRYHRPPDPTGTRSDTEVDEQQVVGLFRGAIHETDEGIGRLLAHLRERGLDKDTIVVVVSDHGENLGAHDHGIGHGEHLKGEAALRVPFLFAGPGVPEGEVRDGIARTVDLAPTLLGLLGLDALGADGADLSGWLAGGAAPALYAYAETGIWFNDEGPEFFQKDRLRYPNVMQLGEVDTENGDEVVLRREWATMIHVAKHRAIIEGDWKLIYVPLDGGVRFELYDVRVEGGPDLAAKNPEVVSRLKSRLYEHAEQYEQAHVRAGYILPGPLAPSPWGEPLVPRLASLLPR